MRRKVRVMVVVMNSDGRKPIGGQDHGVQLVRARVWTKPQSDEAYIAVEPDQEIDNPGVDIKEGIKIPKEAVAYAETEKGVIPVLLTDNERETNDVEHAIERIAAKNNVPASLFIKV